SDARVFRDPARANELLGRFEELQDLGREGPAAPPQRRITVLGEERTEDDATKDLLRGTTGSIGQHLKEKAALYPLDPDLGRGNRERSFYPVARPRGSEEGVGAVA